MDLDNVFMCLYWHFIPLAFLLISFCTLVVNSEILQNLINA